jgi:hypothetical protein
MSDNDVKNGIKRLEFKLPKVGYDKLTQIAEALEFSGRADLIRAALADYCTARGYELTVGELQIGEWGGPRPYSSKKEDNTHG